MDSEPLLIDPDSFFISLKTFTNVKLYMTGTLDNKKKLTMSNDINVKDQMEKDH